ncbi:MAG: hypothetical protein P8Z73_08740, partial [Desulfobacteraceae bacterium]
WIKSLISSVYGGVVAAGCFLSPCYRDRYSAFLITIAIIWLDEILDIPHGICPECARKLYPDIDLYKK